MHLPLKQWSCLRKNRWLNSLSLAKIAQRTRFCPASCGPTAARWQAMSLRKQIGLHTITSRRMEMGRRRTIGMSLMQEDSRPHALAAHSGFPGTSRFCRGGKFKGVWYVVAVGFRCWPSLFSIWYNILQCFSQVHRMN